MCFINYFIQIRPHFIAIKNQVTQQKMYANCVGDEFLIKPQIFDIKYWLKFDTKYCIKLTKKLE